VESTETIGCAGGRAAAGTGRPAEHLVPDWVRVRSEDFGLLFYDTRSTRLTFVRSGESLVPPPFTGPRRVLRAAALDEERRPVVSRLLQNLVAKGLIVAIEPETSTH
jgi:putative mycofactocin binding protein MftB